MQPTCIEESFSMTLSFSTIINTCHRPRRSPENTAGSVPASLPTHRSCFHLNPTYGHASISTHSKAKQSHRSVISEFSSVEVHPASNQSVISTNGRDPKFKHSTV